MNPPAADDHTRELLALPEFRALLGARGLAALGMSAIATVVEFQTWEVTGDPLALGILGLVLFILAPNEWLLYTGTVLWGLGASLGFPVGMSAAADDTKNAAARVSAVAMIGYFAFLVGPPVLGLLGEAWGILNALFLILALMVLAGLAAPAARERSYAAPAPAPRG